MLKFNGEADHVHLLVEVPPSHSRAVVVNNLKSLGSRMLRKWNGAELAEHHCQPAPWSCSYFLRLGGGTSLETAKADIEGQSANNEQRPTGPWV